MIKLIYCKYIHSPFCSLCIEHGIYPHVSMFPLWDKCSKCICYLHVSGNLITQVFAMTPIEMWLKWRKCKMWMSSENFSMGYLEVKFHFSFPRMAEQNDKELYTNELISQMLNYTLWHYICFRSILKVYINIRII
jgi:hypothetical protein